MENKETFLVLDGNALLHRAWHAIPPLTTKDGVVVNAAYGFTMIVEKMLEKFTPTYMAVAWDLPGGTFRHEMYKEYKGTREKKGPELYDQIPIIQDLLISYGIPSLSAKGFEADDVIATLAELDTEKGIHTLVVTGDLDSMQLVSKTTEVVFFVKGISETKIYDIKAVEERYGLHPDKIIDYKALRGDASDNIPGVPGIGDKGATLLVQEFGSVEGIFKALKKGDVLEKFAKKLKGQEQNALDSKYLVTLIRDVKFKFDLKTAKVKKPDPEKMLDIFRELEFRNLVRKYSRDVPPPPQLNPETKTSSKEKVEIVNSTKDFKKALVSLSQGKVAIIIADQMADLFGSSMAALAISDGKTTVVISNPKEDALKVTNDFLQKSEEVIAHDLKALMHQTGWGFENSFDTMIASYLLHSGSRAHDLPSSSFKQLNKKVPETPKSFASEKDYSALGKIVSILPELSVKLKTELKKVKMTKVFEDIEMPLVPILYQMETSGIELDVKNLEVFSKELKKKIDSITKKVIKLAGKDFNLNSPSQLAEVLFEKLSLPTKRIKKTKTGFSTAASELEKLWDEHKIIPLMSEYRELAKLQSTYVEALPRLAQKDNRVHTSFNQAVTSTGRLSSSEPNLQNIPIRTDLGREIRKAFIAPKGKVLIAADYSQIELRLLAILAKDKPFIGAFNSGADIHTRTAAEILEIKETDVTKAQRRNAKAINFGIMFGMGPKALSRSTGTTMTEAKEYIAKYFEIHSSVKNFIDKTKAKAHDDGYVETLFGRRRYFPEIESGIPMLIAQAERMAVNLPVQGAEADIMKLAMIKVDEWLKQNDLQVTMLLQVHDEIVFEAKKADAEKVAKKIKEVMESVASYEVPLVVDVEIGKNWGEMKRV
jgi:DNA polymerase I